MVVCLCVVPGACNGLLTTLYSPRSHFGWAAESVNALVSLDESQPEMILSIKFACSTECVHRRAGYERGPGTKGEQVLALVLYGGCFGQSLAA